MYEGIAVSPLTSGKNSLKYLKSQHEFNSYCIFYRDGVPRDLRNPVFKPSDDTEPNVIEPDRKDKPDVVQSKAEIDMMIATANKFFRTSKTKKGMGSNLAHLRV